MTDNSFIQQRFEEIICSFDYDGFKASEIESLNSEIISSILSAAKNDDKLWQELANWAKESKTDFDAERLREALPSDKSEMEPKELLTSLGVSDEQAIAILDFLQSQINKELLIKKAFEADNPEETAKMLEEAVKEEKVNFLFRELPVPKVLSDLLYFALFASMLGACARMTALYKGVTPRN